MSFRDRPNADEKFLREMLRQQDARRAEAVKEVKGNPEHREKDDGTDGGAVTHPPPKNPREARFYEMYDAGLSDREIAEAMGFSKKWAQWYRTQRGLAPNRKHGDSGKERRGQSSKGGRKFSEAKLATVAKCAREGMTDVAIAERLGACADSVSKMRRHLGIAPLEDYRTVLGEVG